MEAKKSRKADLENKKAIFFQIGLVVALGLTLLAFEWKSYDNNTEDTINQQAAKVYEDVVLQTQQNIPLPFPQPPHQQTTILKIVENNINTNIELIQETVVEVNKDTILEEEKTEEETIINTIINEKPDFPGGNEARIQFLQNNIIDPTAARESGIQGIVYITFIVEKDGSINDVKIVNGIGGGCDQEAIRVVKAMPKWSAGKKNGKAIRAQMNLQIQFALN